MPRRTTTWDLPSTSKASWKKRWRRAVGKELFALLERPFDPDFGGARRNLLERAESIQVYAKTQSYMLAELPHPRRTK